ncbi:MAG: sensor histidine kinase [Janthinobacterium lividum]
MSPAATAFHLTVRQKWKLAAGLVLLYYPILFYIDFPEWEHSWAGVVRTLPIQLVGIVVTLGFYFLWLNMVEWIQGRLPGRFGDDFLLEMKLSAQLITLGISLVLAAVFIAAYGVLQGYVRELLLQFITPPPEALNLSSEHRALFLRANKGFFLMLMLTAFYLIANSQALLRVRAFHQRAEQLENATLQAQLAALKNQVNPHFLFNSLSILSSLVHVDAALSERFVEQLARAYRYTLEQKDNDLVLLSTELDFIKSYTFLLKIRFEDKFDVVLDIPDAMRHRYRVAPLTLQLLVENAVKHNQMSVAHPLIVSIAVVADELVVRNTLQRRPRPLAAASTGVGLQNILNRYHLLTPLPIHIGEVAGTFEVRIPLLP